MKPQPATSDLETVAEDVKRTAETDGLLGAPDCYPDRRPSECASEMKAIGEQESDGTV